MATTRRSSGPARHRRARRGLFVVATVAAGALLAACNDPAEPSTTVVTRPADDALLQVGDQDAGGSLTVTRAVLPAPGGYVAIYEVSNDSPGRRLAASTLLGGGEHHDVGIDLDPPVEAGTEVFVMLHHEASGDGELDHPGPDEPIADDGRILTVRVTLG